MNKQTKPNHQTLIQFMLRAQYLARQDARADTGSAMLIASIVTILLFSLLGAFLTMTNLNKSATNAYIDGNNTFYAAESGLNRRASQVRDNFVDYSTPSGTSPLTSTTSLTSAMATCFSVSTTTSITSNDFECRNYSFRYNNNAATAKDSDGNIVVSDVDNNSNSVNYTAFTFVADKTNYATSGTTTLTYPTPSQIPAGQTYAGLNAQEYKYVLYATAAKPDPTNAAQPVRANDAKTVLQMEFKSRIVPLFQFAAFYDGDLEINSTSNMTLSGRVHTNANLYVQPTPQSGTTDNTYFNSPVTSAGSIYNRVDSSTVTRYIGARVLNTGTTYYPASNFRSDMTLSTPLTATEITAFGGKVKDGNAGATVLTIPDAGFLRKRNYFNNKIGEYYAKADLRLEMVPDRDVTNKPTTGIWTRNKAIIPFNFTSIQSGGTGTCTTASPAAGSDPAVTYIDPDRGNAATLKCNIFSKGQLQSLRQPVLVWTHTKQSTSAMQTTEGTTLDKPTLPTAPTLSSTANTSTTKDKILRALQVALVSTPTPIPFDTLNKQFSDAAYSTTGNPAKIFKDEFNRLLNTIPTTTLPAADVTTLTGSTITPNAIAALQGAWFLPAPIQRIENNNTTVQITANPRSSGFYDGREKRWITMLQTNIKSLSVWNRDGLYVDDTNQITTLPSATGYAAAYRTMMASAYTASDANKNLAFNSGTGANFTDGAAFSRAAADSTKPAGSFQYLGLGTSDNTEGGLVLYATVNDDLDDDGTIAAANDAVGDSTNPILKKQADGVTNFTNSAGNTVTIDYPRKYRNGSINQSPFGFAFNGGDYLPQDLTLVTDQAIYIQGNFNNNNATQPTSAPNTPSSTRLAAAIMGDTITVLSNQCLSTNSSQSSTNLLGTPAGQIHCGLASSTTGSVNLDGTGTAYYTVSEPTAVNAAFLSYTRRSNNNLGTNRGYLSTRANADKIYSGGLNNYMRMLEDWTSRYFNYSGSFVSLGTPIEYSGNYLAGGTYYNIPVRNFNFETNFNSFDSLPPLSPRAIYLQQDVFKRTY